MFDYAGALAACGRGNRDALRNLYNQEAGRLISVAQRIVRRRDLAEDVVQDAFLQIWQRAASFDPAYGSARAWIYTVVRNRALNVVRDGSRLELLGDEALETLRTPLSEVGDAFERLDENSRLRVCLEALDEKRRNCLLLAYCAGYTHGEIAGLLRVPLGTAKSWVKRGLAALKDCMA